MPGSCLLKSVRYCQNRTFAPSRPNDLQCRWKAICVESAGNAYRREAVVVAEKGMVGRNRLRPPFPGLFNGGDGLCNRWQEQDIDLSKLHVLHLFLQYSRHNQKKLLPVCSFFPQYRFSKWLSEGLP